MKCTAIQEEFGAIQRRMLDRKEEGKSGKALERYMREEQTKGTYQHEKITEVPLQNHCSSWIPKDM